MCTVEYRRCQLLTFSPCGRLGGCFATALAAEVVVSFPIQATDERWAVRRLMAQDSFFAFARTNA